jgi:hypothetical protein
MQEEFSVPSALESGEAGNDTVEPPRTGGSTDGLLEMYKLAVSMADRISGRRATANAFFLTLNSALLAVAGLVRPTESASNLGVAHPDRFGLLIVVLAGIVLSGVWWILLRSYRALNGAKFTVINAMELRLPAAPFTDEWKILTRSASSRWKRYLELGQIERFVPLVYVCLYVVAGIRAVFA